MLDTAEYPPDPSMAAMGGSGTLRLDSRHRIEAVDAQAARLLGLPTAALLGHCLWDRFPALCGTEPHRRCLALAGAEMPGTQDVLFRFEPLDRWYVVVITPLPAKALEIRFTDVTDTPGGIAAQLRAERLDAAALATGRLSHDFNNCLTVIMGNAEYLEELLADQAELLEAVRFIGQAGERAAALTGRVLQFARRKAPPGDGKAGAQEVLARLENRLRAGAPEHRIEVSSGPGLPLVLAEPAALEAALHELASNGLEAMLPGGTLRISAAEAEEGRVAFTVADTGHGMARAMLDRCIEPFVTTAEAHWGTGLGLSAAYGFATAHGGALHLESRPGEGTRAVLDLPGTPAEASGVPPPADHVLLVEDDPAGREGIARLLGGLGYGVTAVASAEEAMEALERCRPVPSLLLADVILPGGLDGARLVAEVRRRIPSLPALLMSGYAAQPHGTTLCENGIRLLPKPFRKAELAQAVAEELRTARVA